MFPSGFKIKSKFSNRTQGPSHFLSSSYLCGFFYYSIVSPLFSLRLYSIPKLTMLSHLWTFIYIDSLRRTFLAPLPISIYLANSYSWLDYILLEQGLCLVCTLWHPPVPSTAPGTYYICAAQYTSHFSWVATEHLKCAASELRCIVSVTYVLAFERFGAIKCKLSH